MVSSERPLSQDLVFDILSSPRRRYVLYYLRQADEPVELTTLAEHVAAWENDTDPEDLTEQEKKRVYVSIYQTHIPKLDEAGVVDYDKDEGTITLSKDATFIEEHLMEPSSDVTWYAIYLSIGLAGGVLLLLVAFDVGVFGDAAELVAALVVAGFLATSLAHYLSYRTRKSTIPDKLRRRQ